MKEEVLIIEFQPVFDKWAWKIIHQNEDVLKRWKFTDRELNCESCGSPEFLNGVLFIKGKSEEYDDKINLCTTEEKVIIKEKVRAINEKYGISKPWRAEKYGNYFFIKFEPEGEILTSTERFTPLDDKRYKISNYFKTRELAEKFLADFKKFSMKWHEENGSDGKEEV